jgi:pyrroloquinoline quinone biosynthesis protein A
VRAAYDEQQVGSEPATSATSLTETSIMTWTTPQACDLRFGFEITMYVAAR